MGHRRPGAREFPGISTQLKRHLTTPEPPGADEGVCGREAAGGLVNESCDAVLVPASACSAKALCSCREEAAGSRA